MRLDEFKLIEPMADAAFLAYDHLEPPSAAATAAAEEAAATRRVRIQLTTAMVFCFVFMIGEVIGGYLAGSLAIMTECVTGQQRRAFPPTPRAQYRPPPRRCSASSSSPKIHHSPSTVAS